MLLMMIAVVDSSHLLAKCIILINQVSVRSQDNMQEIKMIKCYVEISSQILKIICRLRRPSVYKQENVEYQYEYKAKNNV